MQMSLHQSLTVDSAHDVNPKFFSHTQYSVFADAYEDRLSTTDSSERGRGTTASMQPYDKEPMFEKPLTPSDVGKLNRLVIPKQYAERYFPVGGGGDAVGTLLGFEDEAGKCWSFRYSYWNSSQSYVLTKGWSRYVKEKRLDAGDVVLFERHRNDPQRLFIGWRRRGVAPAPASTAGSFCYNAQGRFQAQDSRGQGQGGGGDGGAASLHAAAGVSVGVDPEQEPTAGSSNTRRRLVRLFGVNLECQVDNNSSPQTTSSAPSFWSTQQQQPYHNYFEYNQNHHHQMDMNFGEGVNQMGNRPG